MGADPSSPGYTPPAYQPGSSSLGHGPVFGADLYDLYDLYAAGRIYFPNTALLYSNTTRNLDALQSQLESQSSLMDNPAPMVGMEALRDTLQVAMGRTAVLLEQVGAELVRIADRYQRTDEQAHGEFTRLYDQAKAKGTFTEPTPSIPTPPQPDGLHPQAPPAPANHAGSNVPSSTGH